eukprot:CAMPEP_0172503966 /NCGR_PEP_ID=MMETSP1066-20121228/174212_1 /TAXON_ID=671091 /ORGANISM="Coscinodiscus wailesii, Strain CCMP2513" /LENGTH=32 /DNA_ID= /DNA_START= /DNA_END= /DNA_ORIENTATION=
MEDDTSNLANPWNVASPTNTDVTNPWLVNDDA